MAGQPLPLVGEKEAAVPLDRRVGAAPLALAATRPSLAGQMDFPPMLALGALGALGAGALAALAALAALLDVRSATMVTAPVQKTGEALQPQTMARAWLARSRA